MNGDFKLWGGAYDLYPPAMDEKPLPVCPVCKSVCTSYFVSPDNDIIGCNECYTEAVEVDAFDYMEDHSHDSDLEFEYFERFRNEVE